MPSALIPIADGTEEMEAVILIDVLRRAGVTVTVASVANTAMITASRGVQLQADCTLNMLTQMEWDLIALPGGMPGAEHLSRSEYLRKQLLNHWEHQHLLGAICAAPAVVLGELGFLQARKATCHPQFQSVLTEVGAQLVEGPVVEDGMLVTSQAPGTAMLFALTLVTRLLGEEAAQKVATPMVFSL